MVVCCISFSDDLPTFDTYYTFFHLLLTFGFDVLELYTMLMEDTSFLDQFLMLCVIGLKVLNSVLLLVILWWHRVICVKLVYSSSFICVIVRLKQLSSTAVGSTVNF